MADDGGRATAAAPFPNGPETAERAPDGRFTIGNRGGPGRPKGSRHRAQAALDAIGEAGAAEVLQAVLQAAKAGDLRAASILLDRVWPARKGRAVEVALPEVASAADLVPALAAVVAAMGRGELTPEEARAVAGVLEAQRKAIETAELEARVAALEQCVSGAGR
jgi:DNA-binding LytR/AlgR family response regulator